MKHSHQWRDRRLATNQPLGISIWPPNSPARISDNGSHPKVTADTLTVLKEYSLS